MPEGRRAAKKELRPERDAHVLLYVGQTLEEAEVPSCLGSQVRRFTHRLSIDNHEFSIRYKFGVDYRSNSGEVIFCDTLERDRCEQNKVAVMAVTRRQQYWVAIRAQQNAAVCWARTGDSNGFELSVVLRAKAFSTSPTRDELPEFDCAFEMFASIVDSVDADG